MPYFLRQIYSNTNWEKTKFPSWLKGGDLPSCVIADLKADGNALSLWEIDEKRLNLPCVIAALVAAQRKWIRNDFDFALIDKNHIDQTRFELKKKSGSTPYASANIFHYDLPNLSINAVVYFAHSLSKFGIFDRMGWKAIETQLKGAVARGDVDQSRIALTLQQQLGIIPDYYGSCEFRDQCNKPII